jgi:hypothetical protein
VHPSHRAPSLTLPTVTPDEREVLERAIRRVTEQAANADVIVDEAMDAGLDGSEPFVVNIKRLCAELLSFKGDLERELEKVQLDCIVCGVSAHYVGGLGVRAGWARETRTARDAEAQTLRPGAAGRAGNHERRSQPSSSSPPAHVSFPRPPSSSSRPVPP